MQRTIQLFTLCLCLILVTTGCIANSKTETVDDAVRLLQDLEDNNAWIALSDGLEVLAEQDGFVAEIRIETFQSARVTSQTAMVVTADANNNALFAIQKDSGETRMFFVPARVSDAASQVIRVENEQGLCSDAGQDAGLLKSGLHGVLESTLADMLGLQLLTVIDTPGDYDDTERVVAGREGMRYTVDSRLEDALAIAEASEQADLQTSLEQTRAFTFSGELVRDKETAALLHFDSNYEDLDQSQRMAFVFTVTSWGANPLDVAAQDKLANLPPCQ